MLKKENRLSTNFEFNVTRKHGKKVFGTLCSMFYVKPTNYQGPAKVGIVVSKKVHKSAVKRNRLKRLFVECISKKLDNIPKDHWVVFHPRTESLESKYEEICIDVNKVLSKISLT